MINVSKQTIQRKYLNVINYIRVNFLEKKELETPEQIEENKKIAETHHELILKNIKTCHNKLQVDTIYKMIDMFNQRYGEIRKDLYIDLREKLNYQMDKLCMYN